MTRIIQSPDESKKELAKFLFHQEAYITYDNNHHITFHTVRFTDSLDDAVPLCRIRCRDEDHAIYVINQFADEYCGDDKFYGYCWVSKDNTL